MNELRAGEPYTIGNVTLVLIERIYMQSEHGDIGYYLTALKEPYAIIIRDTKGIHVLNPEAKVISFEKLRQEVSGLDRILP